MPTITHRKIPAETPATTPIMMLILAVSFSYLLHILPWRWGSCNFCACPLHFSKQFSVSSSRKFVHLRHPLEPHSRQSWSEQLTFWQSCWLEWSVYPGEHWQVPLRHWDFHPQLMSVGHSPRHLWKIHVNSDTIGQISSSFFFLFISKFNPRWGSRNHSSPTFCNVHELLKWHAFPMLWLNK